MSEGKRCPLNMRTTQAVRDRLEKAAQQSGRSLAQEVEFRLQRSFDLEDVRLAVREEFTRWGAGAFPEYAPQPIARADKDQDWLDA